MNLGLGGSCGINNMALVEHIWASRTFRIVLFKAMFGAFGALGSFPKCHLCQNTTPMVVFLFHPTFYNLGYTSVLVYNIGKFFRSSQKNLKD